MGNAQMSRWLGAVCYSVATVDRGYREKQEACSQDTPRSDSKDRILVIKQDGHFKPRVSMIVILSQPVSSENQTGQMWFGSVLETRPLNHILIVSEGSERGR